MKTILSILLFFLCLNLQSQTLINGQSYNKKNAIISASVIGATFITTESFGQNMSRNQIATLNFSGIAISAGYSLLVTTKPVKKLQHRIKLKRNKKINETKNNYLCSY